jgi:hypothetical protein
MTTLDGVTKKKPAEQSAEQQVAAELVRLAQEQGLSLTGPDGLLKQLTKTVLETALNEEMTEHLGYEKHDPPGAGTANIRNGTRAKTVLTDTTGPVELDVPRDRAATFEPQIVKKRQRRLSGVDEVVLSLYAKGLTTGEISAHFAEIYGASVSRETISRITDKVIEEMNDWAVRPLDEIYAAIFIDAIVVKVRDGQVANRPFYAAIGVSLAGERDILGLWAGTGRGREILDERTDRLAYPRGQVGIFLMATDRICRAGGSLLAKLSPAQINSQGARRGLAHCGRAQITSIYRSRLDARIHFGGHRGDVGPGKTRRGCGTRRYRRAVGWARCGAPNFFTSDVRAWGSAAYCAPRLAFHRARGGATRLWHHRWTTGIPDDRIGGHPHVGTHSAG